jgi:hypothetical protein
MPPPEPMDLNISDSGIVLKARATAGPSTPYLAKCASYFAQDDKVLGWVGQQQATARINRRSFDSVSREVRELLRSG